MPARLANLEFLISRRESFGVAKGVCLGCCGSCKADTGHICKTKTSARTLMGSIRVLSGRLLDLGLLVFSPNGLAIFDLSQIWPLLPRPEVC